MSLITSIKAITLLGLAAIVTVAYLPSVYQGLCLMLPVLYLLLLTVILMRPGLLLIV